MPDTGLTVAVTGPTGDIGRALLRALERRRDVKSVLGMARRPFDPSLLGLRKTTYRRGDVLDRDAVESLVAEADVVVHLAFIIIGDLDEAHRVNIEGSRIVFEAAVAAPRVKRLVYTSSVAAYGFHADNPQPLTEDVPPRGTEAHYYSAQKAEMEGVLDEVAADDGTDVYVFRPCIVAGEDALALVRNIPYVKVGEKLPPPLRRLLDIVPGLHPVVPDPGVPFQLVHHVDVASALAAAVSGHGAPGVYNLAGPGELTMADLAHAVGWYSVPVPDVAVEVTAEVLGRMPFMPAEAQWVNVARAAVIMDTAKARRELRWRPRHDARATLAATIAAARKEWLL